jgi:Subtilase family
MSNHPIQVILDRERWHHAVKPEKRPRRLKDFYADRDDEFKLHKSHIVGQVRHAESSLQRQSATGLGYAKLSLRSDALAKGHRPEVLFPFDETPMVGVDGLGELIYEVSAPALAAVAERMVADAEEHTTMRFDEREKKEFPSPSPEKHELGAIADFGLILPDDRVAFSASEAVEWLSDARTTGSYQVELFRAIPPHKQWDAFPAAVTNLFETFVSGLGDFPGLECDRLDQTNKYSPWLRVRLSVERHPAVHPFETNTTRAPGALSAPFDPSITRHQALLHFLGQHPLVRHVNPAPLLTRSVPGAQMPLALPLSVPKRATTLPLPIVGVVDGGLGASLDDWIVDRKDVLKPEHRSLEHGTFIGGLLVAASTFNSHYAADLEPDGCDLVDLALLPDLDNPAVAPLYGGAGGFLEELQQAIYYLRTRRRVRVFNVSVNTRYPATPSLYSFEAQRIDEIADDNDAIIVLSGGNLEPPRREWRSSTIETLTDLARGRGDEAIFRPAESVRSICVAAVNCPGDPGCITSAPARYSRRGPGLKCGVKPDVAHFGGSHGHGLQSVDPKGGAVRDWGTSYAAPLVAKTLAALDQKIDGLSRETLLALLFHHCRIREPLTKPGLRALARDFVGFGIPDSSEKILNGADSAITLVFAGRLKPKQFFEFPLRWPPSLVTPEGKCRGHVRMTLVYTPPLHHQYKTEIVRVNLDAKLQQYNVKGKPKSYPNKFGARNHPDADSGFEKDLISEQLKWWPVKVYEHWSEDGIGETSSWRLKVKSISRQRTSMPEDGVPFTVLLTITDLDDEADVFNEMRWELQAAGVRISDIQLASRVTTRI